MISAGRLNTGGRTTVVEFDFGGDFRFSGGGGGFESVRRSGVRVGCIKTVRADGCLLWAYRGD